MNKKLVVITLATLLSGPAFADDDLVIDSAVGGAIGGAVGGAVGAAVGGREGAIVGAGVGAAAGTAVNTSEYEDNDHKSKHIEVHDHHGSGNFCPPGQAKKGRC